jgi:hypothetical protein
VTVVWAILAALGLGIITNNLYDLMPWLAHRRRRRRIEPADKPWLARILRRWVRTKDAVRDLLLMGTWSSDDWNHPLLLIRMSSEHDERRFP